MPDEITVSMTRQGHGPWRWWVLRDGVRIAEGEHYDTTAAVNAAAERLVRAPHSTTVAQRAEALAVACPRCEAPVGSRCRSDLAGLVTESHAARVVAAGPAGKGQR